MSDPTDNTLEHAGAQHEPLKSWCTCGHRAPSGRALDPADRCEYCIAIEQQLQTWTSENAIASISAILEPFDDERREHIIKALPYCLHCGCRVEPGKVPCQCENDA